jgi:hypothetical protein
MEEENRALFTLFRAETRGNEKNNYYPHEEAIRDADDLRRVTSHDHCMARHKNGRRKKDNFISCDVLFADSDGAKTLKDFENQFAGVKYAIKLSRNHQKAKPATKTKPAQPPVDRFHIMFFGFEPLTSQVETTRLLNRLVKVYPFCDENAKDTARFFFASDGEVTIHDAPGTILDLLNTQEEPEELDFNKQDGNELWHKACVGTIPIGERDATLFKIARRLYQEGHTEDDVVAEIIRIYNTRVEKDDEFTEADAVKCAHQGIRYAERMKNLSLQPQNLLKRLLAEDSIRRLRDTFYLWDGKCWRPEETNSDVMRHVEVKRTIGDIAVAAGASYSHKMMQNYIEYLATKAKRFNAGSTRYSVYLFPNGTLRYDKGKWTFNAGFKKDDDVRSDDNPMFSYEFVPNEDKTAVTAVKKVFEGWGVDAHQILEIINLSLFLRGNPFNLCFNLSGEGANGKSTLLKFIEWLFPVGGVTHVKINKVGQTEHDGAEKFESSYANITSEVNFKKFDVTDLKNILGDEPIEVNPKYKTPYTIYPTCKVIFSGNEPPELRTTSWGDLRRFLTIPFLRKFPNDINFAERKLRPHLAAIFTYCLRRSRHLHGGHLYVNKTYRTETHEKLLESSNSVWQFIKTHSVELDAIQRDVRGFWSAYQYDTEVIDKRQCYGGQRFWREIERFIPGTHYDTTAKRACLKWSPSLDQVMLQLKDGRRSGWGLSTLGKSDDA